MKLVTEEMTPQGVIKGLLGEQDDFACVMVLAETKTGGVILRSSMISNYQRAYLIAFAQAHFAQHGFSFANELAPKVP